MSSQPIFHPWKESSPASGLFSRSLSTQEFMLSKLNDYASGHNCPYLGVTISVSNDNSSQPSLADLQARLERAFIYTRWQHPLIASQIREGKEVTYQVEDAQGVEKWVKRTVQVAQLHGGWAEQHALLSQSAALPSLEGDCAFIYLIVRPEQVNQVSEFDLLLQVHHGLADGAGLRSTMNAILTGLATSTTEPYSWGEEVKRLSPAALDVAYISDESAKAITEMSQEVQLPPLVKPSAESSRRGTSLVTYSFTEPDFLARLLKKAKANGVKLTAVVQTALILTLYKSQELTEQDVFTILSGFDMRRNHLKEPWNARNQFLGAAVGLEMIRVPVALLQESAADAPESSFWTVAQHVQKHWSAIPERQDVVAANELRRGATGFIIGSVLGEISNPPPNKHLILNYVSDPAGNGQFDGEYGAAQEGSPTFKLERYQLVTDESTHKLSCRSHSWNDELSLAITFNSASHTTEDVKRIIDQWANTLISI